MPAANPISASHAIFFRNSLKYGPARGIYFLQRIGYRKSLGFSRFFSPVNDGCHHPDQPKRQ